MRTQRVSNKSLYETNLSGNWIEEKHGKNRLWNHLQKLFIQPINITALGLILWKPKTPKELQFTQYNN